MTETGQDTFCASCDSFGHTLCIMLHIALLVCQQHGPIASCACSVTPLTSNLSAATKLCQCGHLTWGHMDMRLVGMNVLIAAADVEG